MDLDGMPEWRPDDDEASPSSTSGPGEIPQRLRRAELVLSQRCGEILLVLDKVCDKHNIQAVMRTAEAIGVQNMWTVTPSYIKGLSASEVDVPAADAPVDLPPHAQIVGQLHIFMRERDMGSPSYAVENISPKGFGDLWRATCTLPTGVTVVGRADKGKKTAMRYAAEEAMKAVNPDYVPLASTGIVNTQPEVDKAPSNKQRRPPTTSVSKGADRWLSMREFDSSMDCLEAMKAEGWTVWATAFSPTAMELANNVPATALPKKLAIVIGGEALGVSEEILEGCDRQVFLPMYGFTESLNLSVATAMILQRLFDLKYGDAPNTQRGALSASDKNRIRADWWDHLAANPTARRRFEDFADQFHSAELAPLDDIRDLRDEDRKQFLEKTLFKQKHTAGAACGDAPAAPRGGEAAASASATAALPLVGSFAAGLTAALLLQKVFRSK